MTLKKVVPIIAASIFGINTKIQLHRFEIVDKTRMADAMRVFIYGIRADWDSLKKILDFFRNFLAKIDFSRYNNVANLIRVLVRGNPLGLVQWEPMNLVRSERKQQ